MHQLKSCLSIFLSFFIIAASTVSLSQEEDPLNQLLQDTTSFIHLIVMISDNLNCQGATYNSLQSTQLGDTMSDFFEVFLAMNLRDYLLDRLSQEHVMSKATDARQNSQNHLRLFLWMKETRQNTTPEDINNMRQQLENLKAQFESCLQN